MLKMCRVCFKDFAYQGTNLSNIIICHNCFKELEVIYSKIKIDNCRALILYNYNDSFKNLLYLFKGCFDYQLKDVFLSRFIWELKVRYHSYLIIPLPSNKEDDQERGFNHIIEIFKQLGNDIETPLYKNKYFKQSDRNKEERKQVENDIDIKENNKIENRKILLVDDVITTGSSLKRAISLIKKYNPQKIDILVLSKKVKTSSFCRKIAVFFARKSF